MLFLSSCDLQNSSIDTRNASFKFPVVIDQTKFDTIEQWKTEGINQVFPKFIGQYKFSDTIRLDEERRTRNIDEKQFRWEQDVYEFDTLSSDGLQIYTDYNTTIVSGLYYDATKGNLFFPIYVANETTIPKLFVGKDSYVFAL